MNAVTLDRPSESRYERLISGLLQAGAMAVAAIAATYFVAIEGPPQLSQAVTFITYGFYIVVYGGFGCVFGYMLPQSIRQYWRAAESQMPERITMLKSSVLRYFNDIQQFYDWLYVRNDALDGKRPVDVLAEENGMQRLISMVTATHKPVVAMP